MVAMPCSRQVRSLLPFSTSVDLLFRLVMETRGSPVLAIVVNLRELTNWMDEMTAYCWDGLWASWWSACGPAGTSLAMAAAMRAPTNSLPRLNTIYYFAAEMHL
jgi:hypothetical protein